MRESDRSVSQLLENIIDWGDRLARFIHGISLNEFADDELRQAGTSKCIEAIGEACGELLRRHPEFAAAHPHLDLVEAYRTRNRLSHGYDTIDWRTLWNTATKYAPALVAEVRKLISADNAG